MSHPTHISVGVVDRVMEITLDRPDRLNAFTPRMTVELVQALDRADADDEVRAVIVTGAGRGFCAGADLGSSGAKPFAYQGAGMQPAPDEEDSINGLRRDGGGRIATRLASLRKPVIAAINGAAIGVGVTMTLPMDVRIASTTAKFGFVFARRGIAPEAVSSWFLPRVVGIAQASEWALTGRVFDADEALRGGLISRVVEPEDLLSSARAIAREIADNTSGVSVAVTRRMLWSQLTQTDIWQTHDLESRLIAQMKTGPDAAEGVEAFLAKRPAVFEAGLEDHVPDFLPDWPVRPDWAH
ncbi:enoyl-CoA hydratase-related protein [Janibacter alittae]|uniref:Enoyl-CoA hydratase-related protein n=1 Tax=Janibacter alittae TaxID=3115209 RepID=A0ABZ2MG84_9MICO